MSQRGPVILCRDLDQALSGADAVMGLAPRRERVHGHLYTCLVAYHRRYGLTHERLQRCGARVPVLHPGPVNRGVELAGELLDDSERCLVEEQVRNGVPIRMALLYLLSAGAGAGAAIGLTAA